ncbi:hypothetical protein J7T55_008940 [Diaporthe amygdali]|uniref:uncharacterized protein n=1 Tax=Phomopsis amygdali TaxID=1214568 RepID=UPI0022FEFE4F|nr:uncharacterized protein J7T55_008940 [Diaporthe amygdali]KAJ0121773.1 hypothetical protein J7T55_008940 [Diaporthe amygdali]
MFPTRILTGLNRQRLELSRVITNMDMAAYSRPPTPFPTQQEEEDREEDKEELEGEASSRMGRSGMAAWV